MNINIDLLERIVHFASENPRAAAGIIGVMLSMMATQVLKYMIPDSVPEGEY